MTGKGKFVAGMIIFTGILEGLGHLNKIRVISEYYLVCPEPPLCQGQDEPHGVRRALVPLLPCHFGFPPNH